MKKTIIISTIILSFVSFSGYCEEITWRDCVSEAKKNNPDLLSSQAYLNTLEASKAVILSTALPQITSSVTEKSALSSAGVRSEIYTYSISGSQLIFDGFKTVYNIRSAVESVNSAMFLYQTTSANIRNALKVAFIRLLKAQELIKITEEILKRRKQNLKLVELRYEAGLENKGSLLISEAHYAKAEYEMEQAKRNIVLSQRRLITELGREEFAPLKAKGDLSINYADKSSLDFEEISDDIPSVQKLSAESKREKLDLKAAKSEFFPTINFDASIGETENKWTPGNDYWTMGVSFTFPIFEGGSRIAEVKKAKASLKQAEADEKSGRYQAVLDLEENWINWQDAVDNVLVNEKYLTAAEERSKIAEAQYSNGLMSFDDWAIIEDDFVKYKKSVLDAKEQAHIAKANWIKSLGGTLDEE